MGISLRAGMAHLWQDETKELMLLLLHCTTALEGAIGSGEAKSGGGGVA